MNEELYLAFYLYFPELRGKMDLELISDLRFKALAASLDDLLKSNRQITLFELTEMNMSNESRDAITLLSDAVNHPNYTMFVSSKSEFYYDAFQQAEVKITQLTEALRKIKNHKYLLSSLQKAYEKASRYEYHNMYEVIKNIKQEPKSKLMSSKQLMLLNLMQTEGFYSGIPEIDDSGGLLRKNLMTIGGDSGMEKTMVSIWLVLKLLIKHKGMKAAIFEKEMPTQDVTIRLWSRILNRPASQIRNDIIAGDMKYDDYSNYIDKEEVKSNEIAEAISRLLIIDKEDFNDSVDMLKYIETYKFDIWVLDYLTMLESNDDNYNSFIEKQVQNLKKFAESTNSFGIIISQLKQTSDMETRSDKIPLISDLEYGKKLRQLSSWVYMVFKPSYYKLKAVRDDAMYLVSRKTRHGKPNIIPLLSRPELCNYIEPTEYVKKDLIDYIYKYQRG